MHESKAGEGGGDAFVLESYAVWCLAIPRCAWSGQGFGQAWQGSMDYGLSPALSPPPISSSPSHSLPFSSFLVSSLVSSHHITSHHITSQTMVRKDRIFLGRCSSRYAIQHLSRFCDVLIISCHVLLSSFVDHDEVPMHFFCIYYWTTVSRYVPWGV